MPVALSVTYRAWRVWQRNRDSFLRLWKTELWPPFAEPLLYLFALGLGLGRFVTEIEGKTYPEFIAPGILAESVMFACAFECTYGSYIRMEFQRTFEAMIATPVSIEDVITGEILWGTTRGLIVAVVVLIVIWGAGLVSSAMALLVLPVAIIAGFTFSSLSMFFTAIAPSINSFNYYITLGLTPMFLLGGVFFPVDALPEELQVLAQFLPLTHFVDPSRQLVYGQLSGSILSDLIWLLALGLAMYVVSLILMRRRLIK